MATAKLYSAPSTHLAVSGAGTFYGVLVTPVEGSTVVIADTLDLGHAPELSTPSTSGNAPGAFAVMGPWPAAPSPVYVETEMVKFVDGLTLSYTSTTSVTIFYDD